MMSYWRLLQYWLLLSSASHRYFQFDTRHVDFFEQSCWRASLHPPPSSSRHRLSPFTNGKVWYLLVHNTSTPSFFLDSGCQGLFVGLFANGLSLLKAFVLWDTTRVYHYRSLESRSWTFVYFPLVNTWNPTQWEIVQNAKSGYFRPRDLLIPQGRVHW